MYMGDDFETDIIDTIKAINAIIVVTVRIITDIVCFFSASIWKVSDAVKIVSHFLHLKVALIVPVFSSLPALEFFAHS